MIFNAKSIYPSRFSCWVNTLLLPLKLLVPQPIIRKIPGLLSNQDIRLRQVLLRVRGKLLDIGCGNNRLVKMYRQSGGEGTGVDVYSWNSSVMLVEDTSNLPFSAGEFGTITFVASFNHIPNRRDVLNEAHRLLADDGRIVLTNLTPFVSRIWHKWAFWDKNQHERGMKEGETWGFPTAELEQMLQEAGYRVIESRSFSWKLNRILVCIKSRGRRKEEDSNK